MWLICDVNRLINRLYPQNKEPQNRGSFLYAKITKNLTALIAIYISPNKCTDQNNQHDNNLH